MKLTVHTRPFFFLYAFFCIAVTLLLGIAFSSSISADNGKKEAGEQESILTPNANDHILGKKDAPVTIVEYASLSCSHCALFYSEVVPELQKKYIDTGKVKLVYRDFPLNAPALKASMLARCAGKERYFTFLKVLYASQDKWAYDPNYLSSLATIGKVGGISQERFDACMKDVEQENTIIESRKEGEEQLKIESTPTLFINGAKLEGNHSMEALEAAIAPLLSAKK